MCFRPHGATASRRRRSRHHRPAPTLPPLAMLDLSKPGERQAHDFLLRATKGRDRMWTLITLRRREDVLLCVLRWLAPDDKTRAFSLAEVSLTETAVYWRNFATAAAAQSELEHSISTMPRGTAT